MRLALSSAAAPDLGLADLLESCARRGLDAVELVWGHAHGLAAGLDSRGVAARRARLAEAGVRLTAIYLSDDHAADAPEAARLAVAFDVPLVAPLAVADSRTMRRVVTLVAAEGGRVLLRHGTHADEIAAAVALGESLGSGVVGLAWQVDPANDPPDRAAVILQRSAGALHYIRFLGGGPEAAAQDGMGVGPLMGGLALARFAGPLVLSPSTSRYHVAWRAWMGRAGGWGCGSKSAGRAVHSLSPA